MTATDSREERVLRVTRGRWLLIAALSGILVLAVPARSGAGIILNTLQGFDDRTAGWSGSIEGLFSGSGGNTDKIILSAGGRIQWRGERNRWQLRTAYAYEEAGGRNTARNVTSHLRHNFDIVDALATVAFVQAQENPFQRLESRWLFGFGLRADVIDDERGSLLVGVTPMLEMERIEGAIDPISRGRLSTFLFLSRRFHEKIRIDGTGFYQPLFEDAGNYRTAGTMTIVIGLTGSLDLKSGGSIETNSSPAPGVERTDWATFTSLAFKI